MLRHFEDNKRLGRCQQQAGQQRRPSAEAVGVLHLHALILFREPQHEVLHEEDAAEEFHHPQDNGGGCNQESGAGKGAELFAH